MSKHKMLQIDSAEDIELCSAIMRIWHVPDMTDPIRLFNLEGHVALVTGASWWNRNLSLVDYLMLALRLSVLVTKAF